MGASMFSDRVATQRVWINIKEGFVLLQFYLFLFYDELHLSVFYIYLQF